MSRVIKSSEVTRGVFAAFERDVLGVTLTPQHAGDGQAGWVEEERDPVALAEAEAERQLQAFYEEGLNRGIVDGKAEFERAANEAVAALKNAAEAMVKAREHYLAAMEPQVLELVKAITTRIIRREASLDPEIAATTVQAALRGLADRERLTVCLNPDDWQALREKGIDPLTGIDGLDSVEITVDPSVGPGGCTVASECIHVDATLEHQLEMILSALYE
ncbi:MAG: FliH/SctL family protein [FCB group bacterium]|nr:FliH/SctL family protein [FCB group bacterium]